MILLGSGSPMHPSNELKFPNKCTFSVFGCILSSRACFLLSSPSNLLLYSSWLDHSVLCCFCCWSLLSLCTAYKCLNSISWVHSWCLISIWCDKSFWDSNLFISWKRKEKKTCLMYNLTFHWNWKSWLFPGPNKTNIYNLAPNKLLRVKFSTRKDCEADVSSVCTLSSLAD